jgi:hypothetical protein
VDQGGSEKNPYYQGFDRHPVLPLQIKWIKSWIKWIKGWIKWIKGGSSWIKWIQASRSWPINTRSSRSKLIRIQIRPRDMPIWYHILGTLVEVQGSQPAAPG